MLSLGQFHTCTHAQINHYMKPVAKNKLEGVYRRLFKVLPYFLAVLLWVILATYGQFFLKKVEDLSLFMFDLQYFNEAIQIPGGFLGVAGSFFTQFLHLPWLGSLIWVLFLLITYQLTVNAFNMPERFKALAIIPVVLFIIGNMSLGYGVFIMREQDHFFAPLLGYMAALIPLFAIKLIKATGNSILFLVLWTAIGYPLFGTFALIGTLTAACVTLMNQEIMRGKRWSILAVSIALIILIPLIAYNFYTSYRLADSWHLGLPTISEDEWTYAIRTPLQLALLYLPAIALISHWFKENSKSNLLQVSIYIISITAVWSFWFKDDNFRTELAMSEAVDRFEWQKVIDIYQDAVNSHTKSDARAYASRTKKIASVNSIEEITDIVNSYSNRFFEPTRTMVLYRDLALLKENRALGEAFTMKDGSRMQKSRTIIPMVWQSGKQFYLQYGLVNMCYRWCLEDVIEHNWSYSTLKYMVMHSVIMQEPELADKYINKLRKTLFYRKWARQQDALKSDREKMSAAEPYNSILPYMCFDNHMSNDMMKTETYLINHFLEKEPVSATPEYDRAALLFAMHIQDIPLFWERLFYYINSNNLKVLPRSVQEAALLYSTLEKDGRQLPLDDKVRDSYNEFNRYVQNHPIRSMKESEYPYCQKFGKTFYYFYYFMRDLKTY